MTIQLAASLTAGLLGLIWIMSIVIVARWIRSAPKYPRDNKRKGGLYD